MCPELVARNINVTAFVALPYYPEWEVHQSFNKLQYKKNYENGVNVIRCPLYVPKEATTLKRLVHLSSFAISSGIALFSQVFKKPDVIMLVQPTLFCVPFTLLFAKLTGAKTVMHIQDFEVDALFGLGMMKNGFVSKRVKNIEKWLLQHFDAVSTISLSMIDNAKRKGVNEDKIIHFPNWSDTEFVTPETCGNYLKAEWGFLPSDRIILYSGNIGNKQGLEIVLEAAKYFSNIPSIKFVLVGAGSYVKPLKKKASELALSNVLFKPLQPWDRVPEMLVMADIHLIIQKKGAADAVLPSKLTNILSAGGHALVTAEAHTELGLLAKKNEGVFTCVEPENTQKFIVGIERLLSQNLNSHNIVARKFAERFLAKNKILDQFYLDLKKLVKK